MINKQELIDVINTELEGSDIFLVEVKVSADNIIDVAIDSMGSVTIDDCIALNNKVLDHFDRDVEDYELTVGSYGISDPFKVLQHYKKNMGGEVEVLTTDGKKLKGTLKDADEEGFTLTITKKVKLEGKKRPEMVDEDLNYKYDEIKYTKNIIQF
ncbi:MAG: ribosome assembly cofactor RimP [Sodaliphilus sp.]|nr:ribosome assembly cofactor RimP [Bacteroidales bacterium]MDY2672253.1 ribosome assembly cofactor RimP [Sodaliphilus sp.]